MIEVVDEQLGIMRGDLTQRPVPTTPHGTLGPMASYLTAIDSRSGPEEAFDYMAAFEHAAEWDPGVVEATRLTEGPVARGSEFHVVALFGRRHIPLTYRITEFAAGTRLVLTAESSTLRSVDEITVTPIGSGSIVTYHARLDLKGIWRIGDPMLSISFKKIGDRARDGLRRELNR
jgi:hypothetical protein